MELALSTVGEWFGSAIISKLLDMASSCLGERMLPADTKSELLRVKAALPKIAAVMGVGEALKLKHPNSGVNVWLEQFKEAFLAAEDVLDELKYWELEDMVKNRDQVSGSSSSIIGSLKRKFSGSNISEGTLKRLKEAVEMLDLAAADVGHVLQFAIALDVHGHAKPNNQPVYTSSQETTSFLTESKVFGRENETAIINEWLKKSASHGNISALCIVGAGGLGKTTLAQFIFEEISRENHFDKTIWVCISTSFSVQDITRKILEDLGEKTHNGESLNGLLKSLKERILSKKVFLILDDAWNDDNMRDWENLIAPLKFVQQGSKILLTTRMESVADMFARVLNGERENLVLKSLEEQELLELLNKYAFYGYNPDNHKDLQKIGNDIVKKLRGSPLAAKVIGSLLNSNINFQYWKRILNHDSLINLEQAKDVADVLKLSYYHLPAHLQECFRFCCIFPQDYQFEKDELIKMWMASGFIRQELHGGARPEDIGEEYFNHLYCKSFFGQNPWGENQYVMHDLIHDLAQNVSRGECCRVEPNGKYDNIPSTAQHVSIPESKIEMIFNLRNLRTLVITLIGDQFVPPNYSLKKTLRLLVIQGKARCELPEEIGSLLHLRFLKVNPSMDQQSYKQSYRYLLHNSLYKLYHLQVLEMTGIANLSMYRHTRFLPPRNEDTDYEGIETTGITNLVSLRYMNLPDEVIQKIHGVHKLTSLQELHFFVGRESGHHIDELEMLNNLRDLSIENIENVGDPLEATKANLSRKESLLSLSLKWTEGSNYHDPEQVIDNLRPNTNLKELTIWNYTGHRTPIWMQDSSHLDLSSLTLDSCPLWEALPFLGQIPHLKTLSLIGMHEVKEVDYSCDSTSDCAYPSLERLYCSIMQKWESWAGPHICYGFPNLKELIIIYCPNLANIPTIPCSLFTFEVQFVGLNSLPDMHHSSSITAEAPSCMKSSLRKVQITKCPKLISLNGFLQQKNLDLQSVEELTIKDCENLVQLPTGAFGNFVSLKHLVIKGSPKLVTIDNQSILLPAKLKYLEMGNCGELDVSLLESASHLSTLATLYIVNSANITCIPSSEKAFTYSLPDMHHSSSITAEAPSCMKSSLRRVHITKCPKLISLNGFLQQKNLDLQSVEGLTIEDCENLVQLPTGAFGNLVSLKHLVIKGSPKLVTVDNQSISLPAKLKHLEMGNCGELDVSLLESASHLSTLDTLCIVNSANITCIPSSENAFTSLFSLIISGCDKLIEISSMPPAHTVNQGNNLVSLKISFLSIDHLSLLRIEPLRCLRFVSYLLVCKCSGMEALPEQWLLQNSSTLKSLDIWDASSLRSLPGTMVMLTALKKLHIGKATLLEEIPELPTSLTDKKIKRD